MTQEAGVKLPEHVVVKIEKVLGISPSALEDHGLIKLIEDLCDTALMFDREERSAASSGGESAPPLPSSDAGNGQ